jgi:[ribosomal protein S5]-alanine N-acetyltransferase
MHSELIVPVLAAGPFRLRPFRLTDVDLIRKAAQDPYIPLITTVPAVFTEDEGRQFIERQWSRAPQGIGYSFAIADAASDRAVGQAGLWLQAIGQGRAAEAVDQEQAGQRTAGVNGSDAYLVARHQLTSSANSIKLSHPHH